ncbi:tyrosine-type recombinase/integrase [Streptomyces vinaceus]|uniref:tyrosine-type recombinase/integrase n=1 Tax=Streptomyces vinaceus TaxID=1960 RepID=UPI0036BD2CB7
MTSMDVVSGEQLRALLGDERIPAERRLLFSLLAEGGVRLGDALAADVGDFDAEAGTLRVEAPVKGGGPRVVPVGDATVELMVGALAGREEGPLFAGAAGRVSREAAVRWADAVGHSVHAFAPRPRPHRLEPGQ